MSWVKITVDDLQDVRAATLVESLRTMALGARQEEPTQILIETVVARLRREIAQCPRNFLDADALTVPPEMRSLACRWVIREMQSRLCCDITEAEREQYAQDENYLLRISRCELAVTPPTGSGLAATGVISQTVRDEFLKGREGV